MDAGLLILALSFYFLATFIWLGYLWVQLDILHRYGGWIIGVGCVWHSLGLARLTLEAGFFPVATLGGTLSLFSWALVAAFLLFNWRYPVKVLGALAAPLAALMLCGALILPRQADIPPLLQNFWLSFHIVAALLGNATFTIAFLGGILYLVQEHQIKSKKFGFFYKRLPSLETLDALNYYCINIGFPLLTLGIVTGSLYAQYALGAFWRWDPKETMTLIAWLLYAGLLHERLAVGWRGRRAALLAIAGFVLLMITFVGADFFQRSYHRFGGFGRLP
ncbi:c-type cytochrome biogenesis protein CcsB [Desulfobacca acetoxidans]|uniref:Cytochrome c assembly protein n=1 Tax=Desulfobacca acetoxidans (strain ATCC 700848 / DSM 11109 / ASRB2) TaxID=880072 RepID=F2NI95_DESAR|nr:c-type cytochrome biogenesis protein CcsB [Desulfobacca acetoxidans]AEB09864.1 cytochrome c assembly protein [Desulfobacca acetoxidans DSM 11109]